MRRSIRKFNVPPPGHLNFWRLACSNSLPSGQKSRSNAPPISTGLPLLKDKLRLKSNTLHAFQREICRNDTFKRLLKTLMKELFTNKGEIISCKSVKPCKNWKNSRAYYVRIRDMSGSNSPPFQRNFQIPPSQGTMHSQMPGVCPGGMLKFRIDRRIMRRSIRKFNIPPPGNPPGIWTFEDWLVQIPSPRGKKADQMPHQLVLNCLSSKTIWSSIKHFTCLSERDMP